VTTRSLRVGLLGVGFGATVHLPAFVSEGWDVAAVWSRRAERAREAVAKAGVAAEVVEDWRALVARPDLDAIAVATPPLAHLEMVTAALNAGKHVLCEKPFGLNARDAEAMRALAAERGLIGMVAHEFRYAPQRAHVRALLQEGYVGTPQLVVIELTMGRPAAAAPPPLQPGGVVAEGAGMLAQLGSHYIDGLRDWFGDVASVSGTLRTLRPDRTDPATGAVVQTDADDMFSITLTFASGVTAVMTASSAVAPGQGGRVLVSGTDGVLLTTQRTPNPDAAAGVWAAKASDRQLAELPMPERLRPFEDDRDDRLVAFRLLVRAFEAAIRDGVARVPTFEDGLRCTEIIDAIREAAAAGGVRLVSTAPGG
jgi:predicted dehydrogenase